MEIKPNHIYTIKEKFFKDFPNANLKYNKGEGRPHYYVFDEKNNNSQISWMIPLSSKIEKYESLIEKKAAEDKPCDIVHVCKVGDRKQAFVIQDMFPITKEYVRDAYTINNVPYKVVSKKDIQEIEKKSNKIHHLINRGVKLLPKQVDAKGIENGLLEKINKEDRRRQALAKRSKMER